jgi:UDP-3-O-[3-hydroxymyristoyl] glucosamine N-acyltransferase
MNLSDYFEKKDIVRDSHFLKTMFPKSLEPLSICYAVGELVLGVATGNPNISAIITTRELASHVHEPQGLVVVENPQLAYYQLHNDLVKNGLIRFGPEHFIHPTAQIAPTAVLGNPVLISEGVTVGHRAVIGDNTVIGTGTYIGENVVTSVRGMQDTRINGQFFPIEYAGGVRIGSRCQVLTGSIIQKPYQAFYTEIGDDSIISLKVVLGHGVKIGHGTMVAGNSQIAGNVLIGENVWIGPSATIRDGIRIGDYAKVRIGSVVIQDVGQGEEVSGNFAVPHKRQLRIYTRIKNGKL